MVGQLWWIFVSEKMLQRILKQNIGIQRVSMEVARRRLKQQNSGRVSAVAVRCINDAVQ